jgi:hypothetical protein
MKGFTHFLAGVAVATCFGFAVRASIEQMSSIIILGGIFGYLPDFLDFKLGRFLEDFDYDIDPTLEGDINPQRIAELFVEAIHKARDTGKPVNIKFNTMKLGADSWRQYAIRIDTERKRIVCRVGPIVTTGKTPQPETAPPADKAYGMAYYDANLLHTYDAWTYADIMSGPDFGLIPDGDQIRVDFIPWHRRWSHSLTVGLAVAPLGVLMWLGFSYLFDSSFVPGVAEALVVFMICLYGFWFHVIVDQFGIMGSNLFPPFTKKRSSGLGLFHSNLSIANFGTNWISVAIILYNLNYYADEHVFTTEPVKYFVLTTAIPLAVLVGIYIAYRRLFAKPKPEDQYEQEYMEKMDEMSEIGSGTSE